jgi:hypothetical protein
MRAHLDVQWRGISSGVAAARYAEPAESGGEYFQRRPGRHAPSRHVGLDFDELKEQKIQIQASAMLARWSLQPCGDGAHRILEPEVCF